MDCSPPGSSVHGILQTRILEWVAVSFSRGSSQHRDQIHVSCIEGRFLTPEPLRWTMQKHASRSVAERSYPTSEVRGGGLVELSHTQGQGRRPRGATPHPRSGGCTGKRGPRGATPTSRSGGEVDTLLVQGKEQRLRFAGAVMKRYPHPR